MPYRPKRRIKMKLKECEQFTIRLSENKPVRFNENVMDEVWCEFTSSWKLIHPIDIYYCPEKKMDYLKSWTSDPNAPHDKILNILIYEDGTEIKVPDGTGYNTYRAIESDRRKFG